MITSHLIRLQYLIPNFPWGIDIFFGRSIFATLDNRTLSKVAAEEDLDPNKEYLVIWNRADFAGLFEKMSLPDFIVKDDKMFKRIWELE